MTFASSNGNIQLTCAVNSTKEVAGLEITYKTHKLEKVCTDASMARKEYGLEMAQKITQRINELRAADSVDMLVQFQLGRCHPLKGDRLGQFAMDLVHPYRLVFIKNG